MSAVFYLTSIVLANIVVHSLGIVSFFGISFPAGAPLIGLTFSARDMVQQRYGKLGCWGWMLVATLITLLFNPDLALASVSAFVVAEGCDWLIYSYAGGSFEKRLVFSNLVSTPLDSMVFVLLAFGPAWPVIWGQALIKMISSLVVLPLLKCGKIRGFRTTVPSGQI